MKSVFGFFKKKESAEQVLHFKCNESAIEYAKKCLSSTLLEKHAYAAIVMSVVSYDDESKYGVYMISMDDSGIHKIAVINKPHKTLSSGDLIYWGYAGYNSELDAEVGAGIATIYPSFNLQTEQWVIKEKL